MSQTRGTCTLPVETMEFPPIKQISECYIKPKYQVEDSKQPYYLSPWDLILLTAHYNQKGLLFTKPNPNFSIQNLLQTLKDSLSLTLVHFYPLAGQLATIVDQNQHRSTIYIDCNKGHGVHFVHATIDATISNIFPQDGHVPPVVKSFFEYSNGEINYDAHFLPLLSIQVTELVDGVFIGCSMNHAVADGTSFWHFWNVWSQIQREKGDHMVVYKPIHKRWVPDGYRLNDVHLPYVHPNEFITRFEPPDNLTERFFRFDSKTIARLKAQANSEITSDSKKESRVISSFQALMAVLWKAIIKAQNLPDDQATHCKMAANNRTLLNPPLAREYFGNSLSMAHATTTVTNLLDHGLGSIASSLNQAIISKQSEKSVHDFFETWFESPVVLKLRTIYESGTVQVGSSPRFNVYGNEFDGLGKPVCVRSGGANKFGGKVIVFPAPSHHVGSIDVEICLPFHIMTALQNDVDFMSIVLN